MSDLSPLAQASDNLRRALQENDHLGDSVILWGPYFTAGDLRAILAALSDVHIPGMVEVDRTAWLEAPEGPSAIVDAVPDALPRYFIPAVTP